MGKSILDTLVAETAERLVERKRETSLRDLEDRPLFGSPRIDLAPTLRRDRLSIIAEIKQASPSHGVIRSEFDPRGIAESYDNAGADALSVLTEPVYFMGSLSDMETARQAVSIPVLRKDFIIDPFQLVEARAYGADAVLLIATVLERNQLTELLHASLELQLSTLVEVYDIHELDRIDLDLVETLGVNNRDLHSFEVDLNHAPYVLSHVPDRIVRVAESGMKTARDLASVREAGIDAVLIGETFMLGPDPGEVLRRMRRECESILERVSRP